MKFNIYIVNYYDYDETQFIGAYLFKKHAEKAADYNGGTVKEVDLFGCFKELSKYDSFSYKAHLCSDGFDIRKVPQDSHVLFRGEDSHTCGYFFYFRTNMDPEEYLTRVINHQVYKKFMEKMDDSRGSFLKLTEVEGTVKVEEIKYEQIDPTN